MILLDVLDGILPAKPELCCRTPPRRASMRRTGGCFYVAMTRARQELVLFDCTAERSSFAQEVLSGLPGHRSRPDAVPAGHRPARRRRASRCRLWIWRRSRRLGHGVRHAVFGPGTVEAQRAAA